MKSLLSMLFVVFFSSSFASDISEEKILGFWLSEAGKAVIKIYKVGDTYNGKMVWLLKKHTGEIANPLDVNNDDPKLKKRELLGLDILTGFQYKSGEFKGGKVYDPESGNTYKAYIQFINEDKLKLRGYIGISLFGRTSYWIRQNQAKPNKFVKKEKPLGGAKR